MFIEMYLAALLIATPWNCLYHQHYYLSIVQGFFFHAIL